MGRKDDKRESAGGVHNQRGPATPASNPCQQYGCPPHLDPASAQPAQAVHRHSVPNPALHHAVIFHHVPAFQLRTDNLRGAHCQA